MWLKANHSKFCLPTKKILSQCLKKSISESDKTAHKQIRKYTVLVIFISNISFSQGTNTLMGANIAGMAYASSTTADAWSLFNNVAGLAQVDHVKSSFAYEVRPSLIGASRMAAAISAPSKIATFGIGIFRFGDDIYNEHQLSIGAANQIGNTSLGAKINYTQYWADVVN